MIKTCVFALLALSVFAANLTPGTRLPHALDDMIHNNLGSAAPFEDNLKAVHRVSKDLSPSKSAEILAFLATELPWANMKSLNTIVQNSFKLEENRVESHYIFQSFSQLAEFRYTLINLVRNKESFKIVVSQETRKAFGIQKDTIYHDLRSSPFGLPFDSETILFNEQGDEKEFHEFNRNKLMAGLKIIRGTQRTELLSFDIGGVIKGATDAINGFTDCWKNIVSAFKTVKKEELKQTINGEGFKKYMTKSRYIRSIGIPNDKWSVYLPYYLRLTGADRNPRVKQDFSDILALAEFLPENAWNANDFTFDINTGGTCNSAVALTRNDIIDQRSHIITVIVDGSFQLAPHILIYENYKSVAGGIVESTKSVRKEVPRGLTEADVKGINAMMLITSLQIMADNFGVPFKLPESAFK